MVKTFHIKTSETITHEKQLSVEVETDFVQVYKNIYEHSQKIRSLITYKLLMLILSKLGDENIISFTKADMEAFMNDCECKRVSWYRALSELEDFGLIEKRGANNYRANPKIFWGDKTSERVKLILAETKTELIRELPEG